MAFLRYLGHFTARIPAIIRQRNLEPLDRAVSGKIDSFRYRGRQIRFDCRFGDRKIRAGTLDKAAYSFGYVREIYLRDCYFRHHPDHVYTGARVVLDLGANAGVFAAMMTPVAEFILGVEVNPGLIPVAEHNLRLNAFENFALECGFIGRGGHFDTGTARYLDIESLMEQYNLEHVDLLKADIEGSEYSLFENPGWLSRVGAISMEIHQGYPGLDEMMGAIHGHGFEVALANQDLVRVGRAMDAEFLYAWK